jgi:hypothetical protein
MIATQRIYHERLGFGAGISSIGCITFDLRKENWLCSSNTSGKPLPASSKIRRGLQHHKKIPAAAAGATMTDRKCSVMNAAPITAGIG